jgi:RNA polymerase sigma factor (sigma-70 family)
MSLDVEKTIREFGPALARVASAYERNPALREELLQDIFLSLVTALPTLRDPSRLRAFIFRVAHHRSVAHVMKQLRQPPQGEAPPEPPSLAPDQEARLIVEERSSALLLAVQRLKLPYRQVITLFLEDLTYEEIADSLGLSVANVGVRVSRAKQQLRELLSDG